MRLKLLMGIVCVPLVLGLLTFAGFQVYTQKAYRDYRNTMLKSVLEGGVSVENEVHRWKLDLSGRPFEPLELEFFVQNKSAVVVNGLLVFTVQIDQKGFETSWLNVAIDAFLKEGFTIEQLTSGKLARESSSLAAIGRYLSRGRRTLPNLTYEPIKGSQAEDGYVFSFRKPVFLRPGEVQRVSHKPDLPYQKAGGLLSVRVSGIEF